MIDLPGQAIYDFYKTKTRAKLWVHDRFGPKVEMDTAHYFRDEASMPMLEQIALQECRGTVLDIGAGAGSHALALQEKGLLVVALEISPLAAEVMQQRGVENVICGDVFALQDQRYDTLLLLMNGIGLVGSLEGLKTFLNNAEHLINTGGQLIFDSSNVAYLYEHVVPEDLSYYYGQVSCFYSYKKEETEYFNWLYIDRITLATIAKEEGWKMDLLYDDGDDQYLVKLTRR